MSRHRKKADAKKAVKKKRRGGGFIDDAAEEVRTPGAPLRACCPPDCVRADCCKVQQACAALQAPVQPKSAAAAAASAAAASRLDRLERLVSSANRHGAAAAAG